MLPSASTAGLPTGCRLSAICTPSCIANGALSPRAVETRTALPDGAFRDARHELALAGDHHVGLGVAKLHARAVAVAAIRNRCPRMATSPPGIAAVGVMLSMRGVRSVANAV